jgi:hypothetical protein
MHALLMTAIMILDVPIPQLKKIILINVLPSIVILKLESTTLQ